MSAPPPAATHRPGAALGRAIRRATPGAAEPDERCDLCAAPLPHRHRHVLDEQSDDLLCVCQACNLLFQRDAAGRGHYRLVPDRRTRLDPVSPRELGVPVGLAFFVAGADGSVVAHYPSPLGLTRWQVDPPAWDRMRDRCPPLCDLVPGVQALLVNTARDAGEYWIVPIDDCYRLAALIRREWKGLSGGGSVWPAIERFFGDLARRSGAKAPTTVE